MRIHFSASIEDMPSTIGLYRLIRDTVLDHGDTLTRDWIEEAYERSLETKKTKVAHYNQNEAKEIADKTRKAIADCDVAIFESTLQSFGVGYQAALAVGLQKPILIIQKSGSRPLGVIAKANHTALKRVSDYTTEDQLRKIVTQFIEANDISTKELRFNMMLDRELLYFLTNESDDTGKSKSQIVRDLLREASSKKNDQM